MQNSTALRANVDPATLAILREIQKAARSAGSDLLLIGASARDYWLQVHDCYIGRATEDYDLAVLVNSWDAYQRLAQDLVDAGHLSRDCTQQQRFRSGELILDLVPFGELESPPGTITWPPEGAFQMSTVGFREALAAGIPVDLGDGLYFKIATLASLVLLKLIAWRDRSTNKDAYDVMLIARHYADVVNPDRLTDDGARLIHEYGDFQIAGAALLGRDIRSLSSQAVLDVAHCILTNAIHYRDSGRFLAAAIDALPDSDTSEDLAISLLQAVINELKALQR